MEDLQTSDPHEHSKNIRKELQELAEHMRRDLAKIDNPQAKALFETSAEVLYGLINAFTHFEGKSEEAWK